MRDKTRNVRGDKTFCSLSLIVSHERDQSYKTGYCLSGWPHVVIDWCQFHGRASNRARFNFVCSSCCSCCVVEMQTNNDR